MKAQSTSIDSIQQLLASTPADTHKISILLNLSVKELGENAYDKAHNHAEEGLELAQKINYRQGTANAYYQLSKINLREFEPSKCLQNASSALKIFRELDRSIEIANIFCVLAEAQEQLNNFQEAIRNHQVALKLFETRSDISKVAECYNNIATDYYYQGMYSEAIANYDKALSIQLSLKQEEKCAGSYNCLGAIQYQIGNYPEALKYFLKSLKIHEKFGNRLKMAGAYNNMANIYTDQKNYFEALKNFHLALKIYKEKGSALNEAFVYDNIGGVYNLMGNDAVGLKYHLMALEIEKTLKSATKINISRVLNNCALTYTNIGNHKEALKYSYEALKLRKEVGDNFGMAETYGTIADIHLKQHDYHNAKIVLDSAEQVSFRVKSNKCFAGTYFSFFSVDSAMGDYKRAFEHHKLYKFFHDSLYNEENTKKIMQAAITYEFEKKTAVAKAENERISAIANAENKKKKIIIISVCAIMIIVFGFGLFIYINYRQQQKINTILEVQKKESDINIRYARQIQEAILPETLFYPEETTDYFIYYRPKDVVSGDFYWRYRIGNVLYFAVVDCTGHGVPGAMMSMLAYDLLEYAIKDKALLEPDEILNLVNNMIIEKLDPHQNKASTDGMDITLCRMNINTRELVCAAAKNPLLIYSEGKLESLPVTKISIGFQSGTQFTQSSRILRPLDTLWLFTDGYCDQKGGKEAKKYTLNRLKNLISEITTLPCSEQKNRITAEFEAWKGAYSQRDDVLIVGVKI
jgi:serine phosphatase RsbU (regulator of sigma subunit)